VEAKKGLLVKSVAGHDKGYFVIVKTENNFVYLANGKSRKLDNPKRKNIKHIRLTVKEIVLEEMTDRKLRKLLNEYSTRSEESAGE
jgi:ribosomal protein L14E/L6E/L27E